MRPRLRSVQNSGPRRLDRARHVEPQREGFVPAHPPVLLVARQLAAAPGIDRGVGAVGRGVGVGDLGADRLAGAKAGVEQVEPGEFVERAGVVVVMLRLAAHRALPLDPEPGEVLADRSLELVARAAPVDVLGAQDEASARGLRLEVALERRAGVTQMHVARRAGCEAGHERALWGGVHGATLACPGAPTRPSSRSHRSPPRRPRPPCPTRAPP